MEVKKFLNLIKLAHKNGADLIKYLQTYEPNDIVIKSKDSKYKIKGGLWHNKHRWDLFKKAQTPYKWHKSAFSFG